MQIESGPTGERKVRTLLLFLMVAIFAVWFGYDGAWGYPKKNRVELIETLPTEQREKAANAVVYPKVNFETFQKLVRAVNEGKLDVQNKELEVFSRPSTVIEKKQALTSLLGGPPSFDSDKNFYYFGPALGFQFDLDGSNLKMGLIKTQHTEIDITYQKGLAIVLAIAAIYAAFFTIRVRGTNALLDDSGLTYKSKSPIHWVSMKALDSSRFADKGQVDLIWDDHGTEKRLRLDEYHLARFNEIIDAICEKKGFENPLIKPPEDAAPPATETAV